MADFVSSPDRSSQVLTYGIQRFRIPWHIFFPNKKPAIPSDISRNGRYAEQSASFHDEATFLFSYLSTENHRSDQFLQPKNSVVQHTTFNPRKDHVRRT